MNAASTISSPSTPLLLATDLQRLERRTVAEILRDDELAAARVRHAVGGAELVQHPRAVDAVPGLERSGRIVDTGMDDLAVVRARAASRARLAFEDADAVAAPGDAPAAARPTTPAPMMTVSMRVVSMQCSERKWYDTEFASVCAGPV